MTPTTAVLSAMEMGLPTTVDNTTVEETREPTQHKIAYWDDLDSKVITIYQIFCAVIMVGAVVVIIEGSVLKDPYSLALGITALGLSGGGGIFAGRVRRLKVVADLGRRVEQLEDQTNKMSETGRKLATHVLVLKKQNTKLEQANARLESDLKVFNDENDELKASNDELHQNLTILNESIAKLSGVGTQHLKRQEALLIREEDAAKHLEETEQKMEELLHLTELIKKIKELNPEIIRKAEKELDFTIGL